MKLEIRNLDDLNPERYTALRDECLSQIEVFTREGWTDKAVSAMQDCAEVAEVIKACEAFEDYRVKHGTLLALGMLFDTQVGASDNPVLHALSRGIAVGETLVTPADMWGAVADEKKRRALDEVESDVSEMDERVREFGHPLHPVSHRPPHHRMYRRILMSRGFTVIPAMNQHGGSTISVTNECVTYEVEREAFDPDIIRSISDALASDGLFFRVNSEVTPDLAIVRWNVSGWMDSKLHARYDNGEDAAIAKVITATKKKERVK